MVVGMAQVWTITPASHFLFQLSYRCEELERSRGECRILQGALRILLFIQLVNSRVDPLFIAHPSANRTIYETMKTTETAAGCYGVARERDRSRRGSGEGADARVAPRRRR